MKNNEDLQILFSNSTKIWPNMSNILVALENLKENGCTIDETWR